MNKIKVMHLTYDMRIGGTEMVIKNIVEGLDTEQFAMSIYCIESPIGPWGIDLQKSGISIDVKERKPGFDFKVITAIRKHLKHYKIDIIHCHQYTPWVYGVLAAFGLKTRVIFTEHGRFYPDSSSWKRKFINPWLCKITDHITAISKATKQALVEFENIHEEQIEVLYNGIAPLVVEPAKVEALRSTLNLAQNTTVLGTIARLDPIKNHTMMLDAFALVLKERPDTVLIIVGDGDERINITNQIQQLGIKDKVIMPGYDPQPQHYLALMDIFLLSSLSEGTSMTLLEAMSLNKPCVVTDSGGNGEVVENRITGSVTENDVAKDFAAAILEIIRDKTKRTQMELSSRERFDHYFSLNHMNSGYQRIYLNFSDKIRP